MTTPTESKPDGRWAPGESGNPNGRRPSHGVGSLVARHRDGTLDEPAQAYIHSIATGYADDGGGWDRTGNRERDLMDATAFIVFVIEQVKADCAQHGVMTKNGRVRPVVARQLLSFVNTLRCNLVALGLRPDRASAAGTTCATCGNSFADLNSYLQHHAPCRTQPAPAPAVATVVETATAVADAAGEPESAA